jgi:hypothetical protein
MRKIQIHMAARLLFSANRNDYNGIHAGAGLRGNKREMLFRNRCLLLLLAPFLVSIAILAGSAGAKRPAAQYLLSQMPEILAIARLVADNLRPLPLLTAPFVEICSPTTGIEGDSSISGSSDRPRARRRFVCRQ